MRKNIKHRSFKVGRAEELRSKDIKQLRNLALSAYIALKKYNSYKQAVKSS